MFDGNGAGPLISYASVGQLPTRSLCESRCGEFRPL